jgi:hypothetical protein
MKKAYSAVSDPPAGLEDVQQFIFAINSLKLGLNYPEQIGRYGFTFALGGVSNDRLAFDGLIVLSANRVCGDSSTLR